MKTLTPYYRPTHYPKPADFGAPLAVLLALFVCGLYAFVRTPAPSAAQPAPGPRLELALSGVLTNQISLSGDDFAPVRCTPTGFYLRTASAAPTGLELRFRGRGGNADATYRLGAGVGPLTLRTVYGGASSPAFRSRSGSVTKSAGVFTFSAALTDAYAQPLLVSGRLSCP